MQEHAPWPAKVAENGENTILERRHGVVVLGKTERVGAKRTRVERARQVGRTGCLDPEGRGQQERNAVEIYKWYMGGQTVLATMQMTEDGGH